MQPRIGLDAACLDLALIISILAMYVTPQIHLLCAGVVAHAYQQRWQNPFRGHCGVWRVIPDMDGDNSSLGEHESEFEPHGWNHAHIWSCSRLACCIMPTSPTPLCAQPQYFVFSTKLWRSGLGIYVIWKLLTAKCFQPPAFACSCLVLQCCFLLVYNAFLSMPTLFLECGMQHVRNLLIIVRLDISTHVSSHVCEPWSLKYYWFQHSKTACERLIDCVLVSHVVSSSLLCSASPWSTRSTRQQYWTFKSLIHGHQALTRSCYWSPSRLEVNSWCTF